jgi:hypothetical protein
MKTTIWFCSRCDLMIESPTIEQAERTRYEHVRDHHPDELDQVEGRLLAPVSLTDSCLHYGDESAGPHAWIACHLCGEREEIPIAHLYPDAVAAEEAVEAVANVFNRTHAERHQDALIAAEPALPENPFE